LTAGQGITVVPANRASWDDLMAVFGPRGEASRCLCQRIRMPHGQWHRLPVSLRAEQLRAQTRCGDPAARETSGLVAYLDGAPVGWCAVAPRPAFQRLMQSQTTVPWAGRAEDKADASVWAVTCFVTRAGFRRRGVSRALAAAAVGFARSRGARAVEGYPLITAPGQDVPWGELSVGTLGIFEAAGFREVSRPVPRRVVMRIDFAGTAAP
jgi:GNAT superfamily N-acetyltransferase